MRRNLRPLGLLVALAMTATSARAQVVTLTSAPRGWIGISFEVNVTRGFPRDHTVVTITEVSREGPAAAAGIRVGDELISINGSSWETQYGRLAETLRPNDPVRIVFNRGGHRQAVTLQAAERPADVALTPVLALTLRADTIVELMYRAMDSLRIRLVSEDGARVAIVGLPAMADSLRTVVRLPDTRVQASGTRPERYLFPDRERSENLPVSEVRPPFGFFTFGGEVHDSLSGELAALNREILGLRSREASRIRALVAGLPPEQRQFDGNDPELIQVREALELAGRRSQELSATMERLLRERASERGGYSFTWSSGVDSMDAVVSTGGMALRPLAPYVLGQNRAAGAEVVDLRPELADYFGVEGGVLLVDVPSGTPAAQAGLQPGDVVTHVDRNAISTVQDLRIGIARGDVDLTLTIVRKGQLLELLLHRE